MHDWCIRIHMCVPRIFPAFPPALSFAIVEEGAVCRLPIWEPIVDFCFIVDFPALFPYSIARLHDQANAGQDRTPEAWWRCWRATPPRRHENSDASCIGGVDPLMGTIGCCW